MTIREFLEKLSSKDPAPGGGALLRWLEPWHPV